MILRILLLIVTLAFLHEGKAQKLTVEGMKPAPMDLSASQYERKDLAGKSCALVKVQLAAQGAKFEGNVIGTEYKTGEYWVYMTEGSYMLTVKHPSFIPLEVNFRDYGISSIKGKNTYKLTLLMPQIGATLFDDNMRYLIMTVEPANSVIFIDGDLKAAQDGTLSILLPMGEHRYEVSAPAYETQTGHFTIGNEKLTLPVKLTSAMATLSINAITTGTQIYVNDQLKGTTSWSGSLPAGNYRIEGRLQGYRSHIQNVTLNKLAKQQVSIPKLQMISGSLNVNCKPINAEVWIDGRKVGTSPDVFRNLTVGQHDVELRAGGYVTKKERVTIAEGQTSTLSISLEAQLTQVEAVTSNMRGTDFESITVNGVSFNMVRVEGGTFQMGNNDSEAEPDESPVHQVTLSPFYIGETEVTQALWEAVMGSNPSYFEGTNLPVEQVSWEDCQEFISKLNSLTGRQFRLPTEAEWEFAARGGTKSLDYKYSGSDIINDVTWCKNNSNGKTYPVGSKRANELGLYDMSGNVMEWCQDWYNKYRSSAPTNPKVPYNESVRVIRGGSWNDAARRCRPSYRSYCTPWRSFNYLGLRLVLIKEGQMTTQSVSLETQSVTQKQTQKTQPITSSTYKSAIETITVNKVSFNMVRVEGGTFLMGSNGIGADDDEKPVHQVMLSSYFIGETEVTQKLWLAVMGNNPSSFKDTNLPVENISWEDCQKFIGKLNSLTGRRFRLPTEAEWEFAARGGIKSRNYTYSGSNAIKDVAWFSNNSNDKTHPVKSKQANELGIYDMTGNVWEWCQDWFSKYSSSAQAHPKGPFSGSDRVIRGGSWNNDAKQSRSSYRDYDTPSYHSSNLGLRLAL